MLRLLVGDECDELRIQVTIGHPETVYCHSEPFGKLRTDSAKRGNVILSRAKDLEILRRPAVGGTPQNDIQMPACRMDAAY